MLFKFMLSTVQKNPLSKVHLLEQPSPDIKLPSSQYSFNSFKPFSHPGTGHVLLGYGFPISQLVQLSNTKAQVLQLVEQ